MPFVRNSVLLIAVALLGLTFVVNGAEGETPSRKTLHRAEADAFFTNGTIVQVGIEASPEALESLRTKPREYVRVNFRAGATVYSNIALHLKGGSGSFRKVDDRPGLTIEFNRYEKGQRFHGLKKLHLNNGAQDPTRLSEYIGGQMFRDASIPAARAAHALVELNGRRLGLYVVMESMDLEFLSRNFVKHSGNLYGQTGGCDVTDAIERMEGDNPLDDLKALAGAVLETNANVRLEKMGKILNVERFISFMAMEVILAHWDGYTMNRHNYRIYSDPGTGLMTFLPHDLDQLMRRVKQGFMLSPRGLVAQAVMNTPELRARYQQRVGWLVTNVFVVSRLTSRVDRAVAAVLPVIASYDSDLAMTFTNNAAELKARIAARGAALQRKINVMNGRVPALAFKNDTAVLKDWRPEPAPLTVRLARTNLDGHAALTMKMTGTNLALATWSTEVLLEPGWYRLEGLARCAGVVSLRKNKFEGAGLYAPGARNLDPFRLTEDFNWQKLGTVFEVSGRDDIDLVCELRAAKGEAWFAEDSLRLVRLSPETVTNLLLREKRAQPGPKPPVVNPMVPIKTAAAEAIKDLKRPAFHFRPPAQWMGEACGALYYQGRYHIFFQFNPFSDSGGKGTGWGHARSPNLVRWEFLPPALLPDALQNSSIMDGPGSAALDGNGRPILFYAQTPEGYPKIKRQQWAAIPEDESLLKWRRVELGLTPGNSGVPRGISPAWGDMFVWRTGERAFATFNQSKGLVCEALNPALTQWKAVGKIPGVTGTSPNFFPLDGRYVLINSGNPISYQVGDFEARKIAFRPRVKTPRILDYGASAKGENSASGLHGTTVFTDAQNRVILLGNISGFKTNHAWNGIMSLPRILKVRDEELIQEPLPELALLRGKPVFLKNAAVTSASKVVDGVRGDLLEVSAEIKPGIAKSFGLRLRGVASGAEELVIRYSPGLLNVAGREIPYTLPAGQIFTCRFFFDRSVLEAFFDESRIAVTRVLYPSTSDLRLEVFADEGDIQVQKLEAWPVRPVW